MSTESDTPRTKEKEAAMRKKYFPHAFGPTFDDMRDFARELERRCAELEGHLKGLLELFDDGSWNQWVTERLAAARAAVEKGKGNL